MTEAHQSTALETTKHPLVVLAVATVLGSVLIPYVNSRIARENRQRELRVSQAVQALRSSSETDRRLNLVLTEFANFVKDESPNDSAARSALRERVYRLYAEFNRDAWWWHWQLLQEIQVLHLVDDDAARIMRAAIEEYAANLKESTQALDPLWGRLISTGTQPGRDVSSVLDSSSLRSMDLLRKRQEIIGRMIAPLVR
jgi:hypothetical protein